ncbi:DEHA2G06424p [Debaryomyces hansenii CBS767]|uniref:DEHA2G06424p n=1 Tax=Debaryomyces hansenii (strain ATCC 36239 / CBS 767 / BCRC 21394 / JCM 1990 / NBRC 0083 / IGC 2968) TaxID=284592 RepID=Q6BIZ5_DEBHA|nr:DEHA2G06424p [Debaryomyces hansenii CBS767]CAG90287.2 DEHA2G06424p [Debaryomyces hansenii CBS767]|eukprot:XP_461826.2 DEHA2G06424p [Debaryomyces hansenii CBS767]
MNSTIVETLEGVMDKLHYHVLGGLDTLFGFGNLYPIFELNLTQEYNLNNLFFIR